MAPEVLWARNVKWVTSVLQKIFFFCPTNYYISTMMKNNTSDLKPLKPTEFQRLAAELLIIMCTPTHM